MSAAVISIVLACYNEARTIERAVRSLLAQRGVETELLVVDGGSTDGTPAIVAGMAAADPRVRLLHNPRRTAPYAFNLGLHAARGEYIAILGAHAEYAPDYLAVCLRELLAHDAAGCSGRIITQAGADTWQARVNVHVLVHPFGSSGASFRTQPEGDSDTLPYPVFRRQILLDLGGYDERLTRNQDNDMNYRVRAAGGRLWLTGATHAVYHARRTVRDLLRYAVQNGQWCGVSARLQPRSLGLRHYIPLLFSIGLAGTAVCLLVPGLRPLGLVGLGVVVLHLLIGAAIGVHTAVRHREPAALFMPLLFFAFHALYGAAFARELVFPRLLAAHTPQEAPAT